MERILELMESKLGYRPQLERDEEGKWSVPAKLIRETGLDVRRYLNRS